MQNGSVGRICPQALPLWYLIANQFQTNYTLGQNISNFNYTAASATAQAQIPALIAASQPDPRTSEDCLFLDVIVPKPIFDNANNMHRKRAGTGAPVLVW